MSGLPGNRYYEINALAIDPKNPNTIYAGTGHGVFRSSDAGGKLECGKLRIAAEATFLPL